MGFRFRIALFFVAALVAVQGLTALTVYRVARSELIEEGQRQLEVAAGAFVRQLDDISSRVADSVQVLALDFALRSAIAQHDEATLLSALRNHGRRVGATRMFLVGLDGRIEADTGDGRARGGTFPFSDLSERALEQPAAAIVALDDGAAWMVVVPVFAPNLLGFIAAAIPVDDALLARLQRQSTLPGSIELVGVDEGGGWSLLASGRERVGMAAALAGRGGQLPAEPLTTRIDGREFVVQAVWLSRSERSAPVAAVLGYSVDEALRPYRSVASAWAGLTLLGLLAGLAGAWLVARSVSRPVERLAASARRIAAGDYEHAGPAAEAGGGRGELADLAAAFTTMIGSIREREARILHQAGHDQVTGLPNRIAAETAIAHDMAAQPGVPAALLMVGLGRIGEIAKTLGHDVCDRVMQEAAARIVAPAGADGGVARATDTRFSIHLPATSRPAAMATAFRVVEALSEPYREADLTLDLAPAVGIALAPEHGESAGTLLRHAEVALIAAQAPEEPVCVYDPATDPHRPERLSLMGDLRAAIEHDALALHYQPKLALASGVVDSAEALVRWQHPVLGRLQPDSFVPLAEESGNIRALTRWVLASGIAQAARWQAEGRSLRLSINVSARDLDSADLPRRIAGLLAIHRVPPGSITLEITESAIMGKPDAAIAVLRQLAGQGIDLAIDDFGVGQSSFAYLRRLPVREIKIDKTFIARVGSVREDQVIVRSIVELGHHLGYRVTAEGVDDPAALAFLADIGCDHAQGFLIAEAMPAGAFEASLGAPA